MVSKGGKRHSPEQIISKLRDVDSMLNAGKPVTELVQHLGVSEQSYYRWRNQYGGMTSEEAKRLKELELVKAMLKEIASVKLSSNVFARIRSRALLASVRRSRISKSLLR